jgi:hypothetical protein
MSRQTKLKQHSQKRVPAPKLRREPLPIAISVKHHLPVSADGTATDLTVAEIEAAAARAAEPEKRLVDYSTSQVNESPPARHSERDDRTDRRDSPSTQNRSIKRTPERRVDQVDLGVGARFVRVPNDVADHLARQLSPAEEKIFDQLWRLTVGFNREVWRGKISDLMIRTGYSSRATVTKAIAGLSALGLLTVEGRDTNPRGRSYRIADRAQLLDQLSKTAELDHSIKKAATSHAKSSRLVEQREAEIARDLRENRASTVAPPQTSRAFKNRHERKDEDSGFMPSSSSSQDDDEEKSSQIRLIYQDLTTNAWGKGDEAAYREIKDLPLPFIILGLCYSITRAVEHRVGSLKYCLPSIKEHHKIMRGFAHKDLLEIAYRHLVRVKEAQRTGKWTGM